MTTGVVFALASAGAGATTATSGKTIVQVAASSPQFSMLVKLVKAAGLAGALAGKGPLTVFAPTNAAFAKVPAKTLNKLAHNKALLKSVLLYHVVKGQYTAARIEHRSALTSLEGAKLKVRVKHGSVYINQAKVITPNIAASNGVIHVINAVLIPPK
jgi:uncharacterized surface protein with fasciclin (FAS1) repeats